MVTSATHRLVEVCEWDPDAGASFIAQNIAMSKGTSNCYLVADDAGDVVINTGTSYQGHRHRERFEELLGRKLAVRAIIFTQSHPDHIGGWSAFDDEGATTIAQAKFAYCRLDRVLLGGFFPPRSIRIVGDLQPPAHRIRWFGDTKDPVISTIFLDSHSFEVGRRRFKLYSTPGGETLDSLVVWLPEEKIVFTGNLMGALYGALPALYTPRGDRLRSAREFISSVDRFLALEPEVLVTGHEEPIVGRELIASGVGKVRDAVSYLHEETIAGMNVGKGLFELMEEIALPPELTPAPGRGPARWYVRAIWEEYTGWFRFESTTELYTVPARAMWPELVALAGGKEVLVEAARAHVAAGRPVEGLHLLDMVLAENPNDAGARELQIEALGQLLEATGGVPHDEITWLESEIVLAQEALSAGRT